MVASGPHLPQGREKIRIEFGGTGAKTNRIPVGVGLWFLEASLLLVRTCDGAEAKNEPHHKRLHISYTWI